MASGSRHSATPDDFDRVARAYARALKPGTIPAEYYAPRVRRSLAGRVVHQLLRVAARLIREERG